MGRKYQTRVQAPACPLARSHGTAKQALCAPNSARGAEWGPTHGRGVSISKGQGSLDSNLAVGETEDEGGAGSVGVASDRALSGGLQAAISVFVRGGPTSGRGVVLTDHFRERPPPLQSSFPPTLCSAWLFPISINLPTYLPISQSSSQCHFPPPS